MAFYIGVWGVELAFLFLCFLGVFLSLLELKRALFLKVGIAFLKKKVGRGECEYTVMLLKMMTFWKRGLTCENIARHLLENGVLTFDWRDTLRLTAVGTYQQPSSYINEH